MSIATETVVRELSQRSKDLSVALEEHLEDNRGEVLPHVFLADVTRRLVSQFAQEDASARAEITEILGVLENRFREGGDEVQELIAVSFLENLPYPGEISYAIHELLDPALAAEFARLRS